MKTNTLADIIREHIDRGEYDQAADRFLKRHNVKMKIARAKDQFPPPWEKKVEPRGYGYRYVIQMFRGNKEITFNFWGSIADREADDRKPFERKKLSAYDILSRIEYLDDDSIVDLGITTVRQIRAIDKMNRDLRMMFSPDELKALAEIR